MPVRKRRQKGWRVSNLLHLTVIFKWHYGSEGVKMRPGISHRLLGYYRFYTYIYTCILTYSFSAGASSRLRGSGDLLGQIRQDCWHWQTDALSLTRIGFLRALIWIMLSRATQLFRVLCARPVLTTQPSAAWERFRSFDWQLIMIIINE